MFETHRGASLERRERMNLGHAIESILGVRESDIEFRPRMQSARLVNSLGKHLSEFVNLARQFIMYTDSLEDPVESWLDFVYRLQVPEAN